MLPFSVHSNGLITDSIYCLVSVMGRGSWYAVSFANDRNCGKTTDHLLLSTFNSEGSNRPEIPTDSEQRGETLFGFFRVNFGTWEFKEFDASGPDWFPESPVAHLRHASW